MATLVRTLSLPYFVSTVPSATFTLQTIRPKQSRMISISILFSSCFLFGPLIILWVLYQADAVGSCNPKCKQLVTVTIATEIWLVLRLVAKKKSPANTACCCIGRTVTQQNMSLLVPDILLRYSICIVTKQQSDFQYQNRPKFLVLL